MSEDERAMLWLVGFMTENAGLVVGLVAALLLAVVLLLAGYIVIFCVLPIMAARAIGGKLRQASTATDAQGRRAELSAGAKFMGSDIGLLSSRGMAAKAEQSLGTTVMRMTWGARLSAVVFSAMAIVASFSMGVVDPQTDMILRPVIVGLALLGLAHVFSYELRYDRDVMISQSLIQGRREMPWRELVEIREESNGTYRMRFADGKRVRVQKYLVGMSDFLTRAHGAIEGRRGHA